MTHTMDGSPVIKGETVYDTAFGVGVVSTLLPDKTFVVKFLDGRQAGYALNGTTNRFNVRTLYWHNPVVIAPPKETKNWDILIEAVKAIYTAVIKRGGFDNVL